jgi:sugar phosphate isomerase/epimerase
MYTRRDIGKAALAGLPLASALVPAMASAMKKINSKFRGVQMGVAGYSYNMLPRQGLLDVITKSMVDFGIGECLLFAPSTEPVDLADKARPARGGGVGLGGGRGASGGRGGSGGRGAGGRGPVSPEQAAALEALRQWHLTVPLDYYAAIRKKFADDGLEINSFDATLGNTTADEDLNRACEVTKALGAKFMMCAVPRSVAKRIAPLAEKHNIEVAFQGRPNINSTDPDTMAKPSDFQEAMGYSKNFGTSIDVGDATGGGWDALKFVQDTHSRVFALNLKDRTKANVSVPWGQGDTRIKDILQLVRDKKYPIRCYIDCDFATAEGTTRLADIQRCMEFAKAALA